MNEPPTLILWDTDEERTLVDRARFAGPRPAFEGSGQATPAKSPSVRGERARQKTEPRLQVAGALLSHYKRQIIETGAAVAVLFGLGTVAYQQWQVAEALRETLAEMQAPQQAIVAARSGEPQQSREAPDRHQLKREALAREIADDERDELERQGAALIASNDFSAALSQYETLAALFPTDRTFRDFVTVLRAKLRCDRSSQPASSACP
ncbi:MAG: hypothetical protein WBB42_14500 [Polyangiales bacterium]